MKIKSCIMLFIAVILLISCSSNKSDNASNEKVNNDVPTDISEENHNKLIKEYETYEERVGASDGQYLNNDSDRGFVTDLAELSWEDRKGMENGEESIFTNVETELLDNFIVLYGLKQDEETAFMFTNNTKYDNPVEYAISLEESIIDTLELDKSSITDEIVNGSGLTDNSDTNNEDSTSGTDGTSKPNDEINLEYEPEYLTQEEWDECVQGNVYTLGECIDYDQYYANGDGQFELAEAEEEDYNDEYYAEDIIPDQETANEVRQYVVDVVNDLTIIDNVITHINLTRVYANEAITGKERDPETASQIQEALEIMKMALDDLESTNAPENTEYFVLEPQLKEIVYEYQNIVEDIESSDDASRGEKEEALKSLDYEVESIESSIAISIIENHYLEYDALLDVWNRKENYQVGGLNEAVISRGFMLEFVQNGVDFEYDVSQFSY